jgi:hypothetical protein
MGYEAQELEAAKQVNRENGLKQYEDLKQHMVARTRRFGMLLSGYLLLQVSPSVTLSCQTPSCPSATVLLCRLRWAGNAIECISIACQQPLQWPIKDTCWQLLT